jgi:thiol-disulfide isomerase/thioredoxin/tetratricopeptide (TPR) repeat protein
MAVAPAVGAELSIGDPAPKLEVTDWVKGGPLDLAQVKGKNIVVLEFWATWCGPCVHSVPTLTKLQQTYADKGVTIVGVTSQDPDNSLEKVKKFVGKQGDKLGYTIAFDKEGQTDKAYMEAAGQEGIPTVFVIDRAARVAWIGHPEDGLEQVLADLVGGKYDIELARKKYGLERDMMAATYEGDAERVVKLADEYITLDRYSLQPWTNKLMVYTMLLDQPDKKVAVARQALEVFNDRPEKLAQLADLLLWPNEGPEFGDIPEADGHRKELEKLALGGVSRAAELAPENVEVRSAQFSVLAAARRDAEAMAVAKETLGLIKDDPMALGGFARVLSSPDPKDPCNDLAIKAVDLALAAEPDEPAHLETKFHVLAVCKHDFEAAARIGHYFVEKAGEEPSLLNGFAWTLLTEELLKDKFNRLALAAAEKCHRVSGGNNWMFLDTLALAKFENGQVAEAIDLEKRALELCPEEGAKILLAESLERFESAGR